MLYVKGTGAGAAYSELVEIKSVPASGSAPETLEVTTLKDAKKKYIEGRQDSPQQEFTFNRTAENYEAVKAICTGVEREFIVVFSDGTGTYIKGAASVYKNEVSVNSVQEATLTITAVDIEDKTANEVRTLIPTISA